ncbi:unnamed protein product [Meganyctiphanes norvegica]|uniref:Uncharacterized protein n=1 Tax=Meganyctiphanes norvegica TaxID=48144 RepID=A0AAV2PY06_MEGNR
MEGEWLQGVFGVVGAIVVLQKAATLSWSLLRSLKRYTLSRCLRKRFVDTYGSWAVVTGGSDGIGKSYAQELAKEGMNVILVARNQDKLTRVANEIGMEFGVETKIIVADFSSGQSVYAHITEMLQGLDIGILVNNVGVMLPVIQTPFVEVSEEDIWTTVNVNMASVPAVTRIVLPGMIERGRGAIVNVGSLLSMVPTPSYAVYAASKAFVDFFTQALCEECRGTGVVVQGLHPGMTDTNLTKGFDKFTPYKSLLGFMYPSASTYSRSALATLGYKDYTTGYWAHGLQAAMVQTMPRWMAIRVMGYNFFRVRQKILQSKQNKTKTK